MAVKFPVYRSIDVQGYRLYPGTPDTPGLKHTFTSGLHLVAGVNGLGKTTLLLMLYHGLVGAAAVKNDDYNVYDPELIMKRDIDRLRTRVDDSAKAAKLTVKFSIGDDLFLVERSIFDLTIQNWEFNGAQQLADEQLYQNAIKFAMNVGTFQDVLILLNFIVFMFEDQARLMWSQRAQRNVFKSLFLSPIASQELSGKAQEISATNSAYRNLLYIVNRDRKAFLKAKAAVENADATSAEYEALMQAISGDSERLDVLLERQISADDNREDARIALERARFAYDEALRDVEALKIARIASAFPNAGNAGHYMLARLLGDKRCLSCGGDDGPLIDRWSSAIESCSCVVCGAPEESHDEIIPRSTLDKARIEKADTRLTSAKLSMESSEVRLSETVNDFNEIDSEISRAKHSISANRQRLQEVSGSLPPTPPELKALEERLAGEEETLAQLQAQQRSAEIEFSKLFDEYRLAIERNAELIRTKFIGRISEFLVEIAEISLETYRAPLGESGQAYPWPVFRLSMTSGAFDNPSARRTVRDVSMSQGEFIDLAFRLALAEVAADESPVTLVFDAPEASLDALFMRRAGAFLARFTEGHLENRLIVTSNLTNADMIPALFGAYTAEAGDPLPTTIPRSERRARVIDLLSIAAPTRAVQLVGDRYRGLLDKALFPPSGAAIEGL